MQELNEALARVLEFLAELPDYRETTSDPYEESILKFFKMKNEVTFNKSSITIVLDKDYGEDFIKAVEQAVGPRRELDQGHVVV